MGKIQIVPTMKDNIEEDSCWSASFNLAWNKFQNEILGNDFSCLNGNEFTDNLMSFSNYNIIFNKNNHDTLVGNDSLELRENLENIINDKYNQNIIQKLDQLKFNEKNIGIYSINEFQFDFEIAYENMNIKKFGNYKRNIEYFGFIQDYSKYNEQITPLFYSDKNHFAVSLYTTSNQSIILYRTDLDGSFEDVFNALQRKIDEASVGEYSLSISSFACPKILVDINHNYKEISGTKFKRNDNETEIKIGNAVQSLKLDLNEKGTKSRDEATLSLNEIVGISHTPQSNFMDFIFNDKFYIFIFDEDNIGFDNPICAIKVKNIEKFI